MENILKEISILAIDLDKDAFTNKQIEDKWLGIDAATLADITAAEERLGITLPDDYKNFLLITNGFFTPADSTEPTFEEIRKIDYLKNIDEFLLEIWNREELADEGNELSKSIVIGGIDDEQYYLLVPPIDKTGEWKYFKFANWIPGVYSYNNLESYFTSVKELLINHG
ncbi:SMI1/KNR4 family protein [Mucilaginibacter pallidiroseus]|uniref:SMI1/KNR4 family protein n=1 Tax=Mucilaginibacter pallidiroseus TaxID=2599295 RepID=A0A563UGL9_9SPHI|nr:SMI1/KNR4 family protein [Mucilaginibacter pallidiroseus]TWR30491.1 SMI1/KNR4 family protein [Mucilaginibacter pallidiroseus]